MKKIIYGLFVIFAVSFVFGEEERLDTAKGVSVSMAKFKKEKGIYTTGSKFIAVTESDPAFVEISFPEKWNITRIFIVSGKTKVHYDFDGVKEVSTMSNFMLKTKTQYGDYREIRRFTNNSLLELEIKEKIKTDALRIQILPYKDGWTDAFGTMAFEIWGYKGEIPKQEKVKINTKEDAKKALRLNEITAKEYTDLLKKLPK